MRYFEVKLVLEKWFLENQVIAGALYTPPENLDSKNPNLDGKPPQCGDHALLELDSSKFKEQPHKRVSYGRSSMLHRHLEMGSALKLVEPLAAVIRFRDYSAEIHDILSVSDAESPPSTSKQDEAFMFVTIIGRTSGITWCLALPTCSAVNGKGTTYRAQAVVSTGEESFLTKQIQERQCSCREYALPASNMQSPGNRFQRISRYLEKSCCS